MHGCTSVCMFSALVHVFNVPMNSLCTVHLNAMINVFITCSTYCIICISYVRMYA